jgi:hypothetical protein
VSAIATPFSGYASDSGCDSVLQSLFDNNVLLSYYPAGLTGTYDLQSDFVAMNGNGTNFICTTPTPAGTSASLSYGLNELNVGPNTILATLANNIEAIYQGDGNLVIYEGSSNTYTAQWAAGHRSSLCSTSGNTCTLDFQGDGNLVSYINGVPTWSSGTENEGSTLTFLSTSPWIQIANSAGTVIWTTADMS